MSDSNDLAHLELVASMLQETNSNKEKIAILAMFPLSQGLFKLTYDPFIHFNLGSHTVLSKGRTTFMENPGTRRFRSFSDLLTGLSNRALVGNAAIASTWHFIEGLGTAALQDLALRVIDRSLKLGISTSTINKAWPGLITEPKVAIPANFAQLKDQIDWQKGMWFACPSYSGIRMHAVFDHCGRLSLYSKNWRKLSNLDSLECNLLRLRLKSQVLDGELVIAPDEINHKRDSGRQHSAEKKCAMGEDAHFYIFDMIPQEDFINGSGKTKFFERLCSLQSEVNSLGRTERYRFSVPPHYLIRDKKSFENILANAESFGWDEVLLRNNTHYEGKKTKNFLAIQRYFEEHCTVLGIKTAVMSFFNNGKYESELLMTHAIVNYKGFRIRVGSGFTMEERKEYSTFPKRLVGKEVIVKHFGEKPTKSHGVALKFPRFLALKEETLGVEFMRAL